MCVNDTQQAEKRFEYYLELRDSELVDIDLREAYERLVALAEEIYGDMVGRVGN